MEIVWTYKKYRERGPNMITGKIGKNQYLKGLDQLHCCVVGTFLNKVLK